MKHEVKSQTLAAFPYRVAIIKALWHEELLQSMVSQVEDFVHALSDQAQCKVYPVAGTLEIPQMLAYIAKQNHTDAAVVIGCVIRGETSHYDHICDTVFSAVDRVACQYNLPVGNAILSTENLSQAHARVNGEHGRKGHDAIAAALSLAQSFRMMKGAND